MTQCLSADQLADWLNDDLSPLDAQAVEQHVDTCRRCQDCLDAHSRGSDSLPLQELDESDHRAARPPLLLGVMQGRIAPSGDSGHRVTIRPATGEPTGGGILPEVPGYEVLAEIGRGGMGVVYQARHLELGRIVALKMVLAGPRTEADDLARFRAEAEILGRLQHPNIVQIFEVGTSGGRPFFAMEYLGGGNLVRYLAGKPQPPALSAALIETLARAIHAAHVRGILHRDLKPANVLLQQDEGGGMKDGLGNAGHDSSFVLDPASVKITDFGLAKRLDEEQGLTRTGSLMGSPSYMAPEQAAGGKDVGVPTDIHALGAILYETLSGRPPFLGVSIQETLEFVRHQEPVPPSHLQPHIPRDLETICRKCLHKEPNRRYATAAELALDLQRFLGGEPVHARPVRAWERGWRWMRRNPVFAAVTALCISLLLTIAVGSSIMAALLQIERSNVRAERMARQQTVVESILDAQPEGLPVLLAEMDERSDEFLPLLQARNTDKSLKPDQRLRLALALTSLGEDRTDELVEAVATAPAGEAANLVAACRALPERGMPSFRAAFAQADGNARFRLAMVLLELGDVEAARQLLAFRGDPEPRTHFIRQFAGWHGDLATLSSTLENHEHSALRSGLCASLGRLDPQGLSPKVRADLRDTLAHLYRHSADGATHGASGWALRRWGENTPVVAMDDHCPSDRDWFITREGLTLVRAESPQPSENKKHAWPLFVADCEVPVSLFRRFLNDSELADDEKPIDWPGVVASICPTDDCPVHQVNLLDIMLFCNWLSSREGRTLCYRPAADKPGFWTCEVAANGYRLPTGPEWGHTCRAGVVTQFNFGSDATLLPDYASVLVPHSEPAGRYLPNDWGLFDTLGNAWEMAMEPPLRQMSFEPGKVNVVLCGGTYGTGSFFSKSESRSTSSGDRRSETVGFRVVLREGVPQDADGSWIAFDMADRLVQQIASAIDPGSGPLTGFSGFDRLRKADPGFFAGVAGSPWYGELLKRTFRAALRERRWDQATRYFAAFVQLSTENNLRECQWAILLADDPSYPEARRQLLERWSASSEWAKISQAAQACSLRTVDRDLAARLVEMAERGSLLVRSADIPDRDFRIGFCAWVEALTLYRAERHEEVLKRSAAAQAAPGMPPRLKFANHLVRAMSLQRLGRVDESRAAYDQAMAIRLPEEGTETFVASWSDFLIIKQLLREASSLLGPTTSTTS